MSPLGQFPRWATRQIPIGYVVIFYPTPPPAIHWPKRGDQQSIRVAITPDVRILGGGRDHRAAKQLGKLHRISINNVGRWRVIRIGWPVLLCLEMRTIRTYESSPRWFGFVFVFFFFLSFHLNMKWSETSTIYNGSSRVSVRMLLQRLSSWRNLTLMNPASHSSNPSCVLERMAFSVRPSWLSSKSRKEAIWLEDSWKKFSGGRRWFSWAPWPHVSCRYTYRPYVDFRFGDLV